MKTRSEWGSYEDWMAVLPYSEHIERQINPESGYSGKYSAKIGGYKYASADTIQEARRIAVESVCRDMDNDETLPWRPDYDLSTVEGCKEAIKSCGYKVNLPYPTCNVSVIEIEDNYRIKCINVEPTLEQWQQAAQFAINNPSEASE